MSIRPFRDIIRRKTKVINVGDVKVGGDYPISVQSMTNTLTTDVKATVKQIFEIQNEGADLMYHFLILLKAKKMSFNDIEYVLKKRMR